MSDEILKKIEERLQVIECDVKVVKKYIPTTDKITNVEYCRRRKMSRRNLDKWFSKGCPREDNRHVSATAVDEWARNNNTRIPHE